MLRRLMRRVEEFPGSVKELLSAPKTLVLNVLWVCALLLTLADSKLLIFVPVLLALWFIGYQVYIDRREGYRLEPLRKLFVALCCALAIGSSLYGYFYMRVNDIQLARVPDEILSNTGFVRDAPQDSSQLLLYGLLRVETRGLKYSDRDIARPPYAGEVLLITLKTVFIPSQELIRDEVTKRVEGLKMEGLTVYRESRREGTGLTRSGHETSWVEWDALLQVPGTGALIDFATGAKIRVRAEWWPCPERGTAVVFVGAAQYGTSPSGARLRDIVLPPGPDDMATYDSILRLIYNTKCS